MRGFDVTGYIHMIDMTVLKKVTYDLTVIELPENKCPAGGIQLCVHIGSYLKKGTKVKIKVNTNADI